MIGLDWAVPDFSTLSRRQKALKVNIPHRGLDGPLHLLVDSPGIKVEGAGTEQLGGRPLPTRGGALGPWTCQAFILSASRTIFRRRLGNFFGNPP